MTNQTPDQDKAQINAVPWLNGRGLITGPIVAACLSALAGTFYLYQPALSGLPSCTPGSMVAPVPTGQPFLCAGIVLIAQ